MKKGLEALSGGENIRFENMMLTEGHACYSHDCCARNNRKRIQKDERGEIRDIERGGYLSMEVKSSQLWREDWPI